MDSNRVNSLTAERVEEQREFMDYILEGNRKIIDCIQAVQASMKGLEGASYTPLARISYQDKHKETLDMMQKPTPPKPRQPDLSFSPQKAPLEDIYQDVSQLRSFVESMQSQGLIGMKELDEIVDKIFQIQNRIYTAANR